MPSGLFQINPLGQIGYDGSDEPRGDYDGGDGPGGEYDDPNAGPERGGGGWPENPDEPTTGYGWPGVN